MRRFYYFLTLFMLLTPLVSAEIFELSETQLLRTSRRSNAETARLLALESNADHEAAKEAQRFGLSAFGQVGYQDSDETPLAPFIPTFGPNYFSSVGLQKNFIGGLALEGRFFSDQQSTADRIIDESTRTGFQLRATVDLWRNLLGRTDRASLASLELTREKEQLLGELKRHAFELELRKLYWAIVANQEQKRVAEELLASARFQLQDGKRRSAQFIADKAEVARYEAQVADREATLLGFDYQLGLLNRRLKGLLPEIAGKTIVLAPVDVEQMNHAVMACAGIIGQEKSTPWHHTGWDEVLNVIANDFERRRQKNSRLAHPDLKLQSSFQMSGVAQGYGDSFDEFGSNAQPGYEISARLDVPLDRKLNRTQKARDVADEQSFLAEKLRIEAEATSYHSEITTLIHALATSVTKLNANNQNLRITIAETKKKFKQARVSVHELVQNEDALLRGLTTEIEAKLRGIETLFDYFKVFNQSPCGVHQVKVD